MIRFIRSNLWVRTASFFALASVLPVLGAGLLTLRLLEETALADASRRHRSACALGSALIRDYLDRANEKLTTVSRLLAKELTDQNVGDYTGSNTNYRSTVVQRLNNTVEPPDMYQELEYYANGAEPQFVARGQQQEYQTKQNMLPQYDEQLKRQTTENIQNPQVFVPLKENRNWMALQPQQNNDFNQLTISTPVSAGKSTLGALVAYLDFDRVNLLLDTVAGETYHVMVMNGERKLLARGGKFRPEDGAAVELPVGYSDWTVSVSEPFSSIHVTVAQVRGRAFLWIGVALAMAVMLSLGFTAGIVQPVAALTKTAQKLESGDLAARTGIARTDEIGRLASAFDRMAAALQKLDEAKSDFVANVSHELRTPLTSIKLSIANLLDEIAGPVDDRQRDTLKRLDADVGRMIHMSNDLLEMAKLEAGASQPRREKIDLAALARECISGIEPLAREKNIAVTIAGDGAVEADRAMIHRVLTNLLDNAVKFTPSGGRVTLTVLDRGFRVADTGPGIEMDRLFEKFVQGRQEGIKNRGFGLGLAIVKKLVDLHGGTIRAENAGGAVFTVTL